MSVKVPDRGSRWVMKESLLPRVEHIITKRNLIIHEKTSWRFRRISFFFNCSNREVLMINQNALKLYYNYRSVIRPKALVLKHVECNSNPDSIA